MNAAVNKPPGGAARRKIVGRVVMLVITGVGLYVVWPSLMEVFSSWPQLIELDPIWFVVMIAAEIVSFLCLWRLFGLALQQHRWRLISTSQLASNAFSRIVPGGAAAGGALQYQMLARGGVEATRAATGLTAVSLLTTASLLALPVLALPALFTGADVADGLVQTALIGGVLFVLMVGAGVVLLTTERPLELVGLAAQRLMNLRRDEPVKDLPERLLLERDLIRRALGARWWSAVLLSVGKWLFDFMALLAALTAVGASPRPSLALLAYVVAAVLGMIPITPGGLGFVEAGLAGSLVLANVPGPDAALATLAYRLVSYWLPLIAGAVAYAVYRHRYPATIDRAPRS